VRCSRGGKTRALYELANAMHGYKDYIGGDLASLYVSFNDFSSLEQWEQDEPLQALLRRIAFIASHEQQDRNTETFANFISKKPIVEEAEFLAWLGDTPCILFIDELNNLKLLQKRDSVEAQKFSTFLRRHFVAKENRYLVFSSNLLATLEGFSFYIDTSSASSRSVILQDLPLVNTLEKATALNRGLDSPREAVYYGLVPGMIYESAQGKPIAGQRQMRTRGFLRNSKNPDADFLSILRSLITGKRDSIPEDLHVLLDSARDDSHGYDQKIRWVPYHLSYVMDRIGDSTWDCSYKKLALTVADLCENVKKSKQESGEGWENLFVLFLLARCLTHSPDNVFIIEKDWFQENPKIFYNDPYDGKRCFAECTNWDEVEEGLIPGKEPQISILYPSHNSFAVYDVVVVFSKDGENKFVYGYQLKEGKASRKHAANPSFYKSFFVQGNPPKEDREDQGWIISSKTAIDTFYGELLAKTLKTLDFFNSEFTRKLWALKSNLICTNPPCQVAHSFSSDSSSILDTQDPPLTC
jgi:hypothetical protein